MPKRKRSPTPPVEDWSQLQLLCSGPEQASYELIRPVVLFGRSAGQRAKETGIPERTIHRKASRFDAVGMASLFDDFLINPPRHRTFPQEIRQAILDLKAEHPAFCLNELATICYVRFDRRPDPDTIRKILAEGPISTNPTRRFAPYAEISDPIDRRMAIVRLHAEGWNIKSIAAYLQTSRPTVYATLRRFIDEGVIGLDDRAHTRNRVALKTDLKAIESVRKLQENPELGEFRVHAALKQLGIELCPRTCGRILALIRKLYGLSGPKAKPRKPREMPFKATRRHEYWTVDLRYLDMHTLGGGMIYVITILENYSRAILASAISRTQDLSAYLLVLFAAIRVHGSPEAIVSDGGGIFKANAVLRICEALGIRREQIEQRQPWQSYIETHFNVQRRMADWHFAKAGTWEELQASHNKWVNDYSVQEHLAHRKREDGRRSPGEVLAWATGKVWEPEELERIFRTNRCGRRVNHAGYIRFRHWDLYGELGLTKRQVAVWLSVDSEMLTVEFSEELLAQYTVIHEFQRQRLKSVTPLRLFETRFRSPQLDLWEPRIVDRRLALLRPDSTPRRRRDVAEDLQQLLFPTDSNLASNR